MEGKRSYIVKVEGHCVFPRKYHIKAKDEKSAEKIAKSFYYKEDKI